MKLEAEQQASNVGTGGARNAKHGENQTVIARSFRNESPEEITKPLK